MSQTSHQTHKTQDVFEKNSILNPFFGSNTPNPELSPEAAAHAALHPCVRLSMEAHKCLEENADRGNFCTSRITKVEHCLRDYKF